VAVIDDERLAGVELEIRTRQWPSVASFW
jgi:hypothetical protein